MERAKGRGCYFLIKAWNWRQGLNPMEKGCVDQLGESVPSPFAPSQSFYIELQSLFFVSPGLPGGSKAKEAKKGLKSSSSSPETTPDEPNELSQS